MYYLILLYTRLLATRSGRLVRFCTSVSFRPSNRGASLQLSSSWHFVTSKRVRVSVLVSCVIIFKHLSLTSTLLSERPEIRTYSSKYNLLTINPLYYPTTGTRPVRRYKSAQKVRLDVVLVSTITAFMMNNSCRYTACVLRTVLVLC